MKTHKMLKIPVAFAAAAFSVALLTAAEPPPEASRRPGPPGGEPPRAQRFVPAQRGFPIESVLNEEQRAQFREAMADQRDKFRDLDEKSATLRREFEETLFAEKLDEKAVREKSAALAELETERSLIRARAFAKIRPSLSEEQLERLKNMRAEAGRGPRPYEGEFRPPGQERGPVDRPERPRSPRGREGGEPGDLPPPRPPGAPR